MIRKKNYPGIRKSFGPARFIRRAVFPLVKANGTSNSRKLLIKFRGKNRFAVRSQYLALKGEAYRTIAQAKLLSFSGAQKALIHIDWPPLGQR